MIHTPRPRCWCPRLLRTLLILPISLTLALPSPAYALRPAGLEEASPSFKDDLTRALGVPAARPASFGPATERGAGGAGLEESPLLELVQRLYPGDQQVFDTPITREVVEGAEERPVVTTMTTVHGLIHQYVLAGRFLFVSPEEWKAHQKSLEPYREAVIVTAMRQHGFGGIWDLQYGHHSRIAVTLLQDPRYADDVIRGHIGFDAGTGDGVLAALAIRLGATHVYAMDRDGRAIEQAEARLEENGVRDRVTLRKGEFANLERAFGSLPSVDFVLANLPDNGLDKGDAGQAMTRMTSWHLSLRDRLNPRWYFLLGAIGARNEDDDEARAIARWMAEGPWRLLEARHDEPWARRPIPRAFVFRRDAAGLEEARPVAAETFLERIGDNLQGLTATGLEEAVQGFFEEAIGLRQAA